MIDLLIPHGGSGTGTSYWSKWADGCPIAAAISEGSHVDCNSKPQALRGTLLHLLIPAWRSGKWDGHEKVRFVDEQCKPVKVETLEESMKAFAWYRDNIPRDQYGEHVAIELTATGKELESLSGVDYATGAVDAIVKLSAEDIARLRAEGVGYFGGGPGYYLYDLKTTGREDGGAWLKWTLYPARVIYWWVAKAKGYDIKGIIYEEFYIRRGYGTRILELPLPTARDEALVRDWLAFAGKQRESYYAAPEKAEPRLSLCYTCQHKWVCPK